jgi:L-arginine dehydrogenase
MMSRLKYFCDSLLSVPFCFKADLPALLSGTCGKPAYERHAFFRSIGLGLEDIAIAHALYRHLTEPSRAQSLQ